MRGVNFMLVCLLKADIQEGKKWQKESEQELRLHAQNANNAITTFTRTKKIHPIESN